jgi:hypothetical protein
MKTLAGHSLLILLSSIAFSGCKEKSGEQIMEQKYAHLYAQADTLSLEITFDPQQGNILNPDLIGFNTAFTFGSGIENSKTFDSLLGTIGPQVLRFPGGTVANFYHPGDKGYGFVRKEMGSIKAFSSLWQYQQQITENIIVPFTQMAQQHKSAVLVVANLVTGTPEETLGMLAWFQKHGVAIAGVELGNELYFRRYRKQFPDVNTYIRTAKAYAEAISAAYPDIPLIVCAPSKMEDGVHGRQPAYFDEWNTRLAAEDFYDGYTIHTYFDLKVCNDFEGAIRRFGCIFDRLSTNIPNQLHELTRYFTNLYGSERQLYITEWNLNPPGVWSNSFVHGAVVSYMLMAMAADTTITAATYHNLAAASDNFAILFANDGNASPTAAYRVFEDYQFLHANKAIMVGANISSHHENQPYITAWEAPGGKKIWLWYVNPFGHSYNIQTAGPEIRSAKIRCHMAKNFLSGRRGDNMEKDGQLVQREYPLNVRNFAVPPFSWGIIELEI